MTTAPEVKAETPDEIAADLHHAVALRFLARYASAQRSAKYYGADLTEDPPGPTHA